MRNPSLFTMGLAGVTFLVTVIWGEPLLRLLRYWRIGKVIRVDGPDRHFTKFGTPTMGGFLFLLPVTLFTLFLHATRIWGLALLGRSVLLPLGVMWGYALLGAVDDWEGIRGKRRGLGMRARTKFVLQWGLALVTALALQHLLQVPQLFLPGIHQPLRLGWLYPLVAMFIIVATSNAINLTDGLDGLAGLISATAFAAYGIIALMQGQIFLARFCFTLVGALFGFLWFNVHPAQLFMGDTGSLALGATLGVVSLMTGEWLLLPLIAVIPLSETVSVMLQVAYFKATGGRRLFKMSPLHHHFELSGWSETQVVQRFWLIGLLAAMAGVAIALA